jgi:protein-S-isoprenylcysteine O-methyltransferase Ste14
MLPFIVIVLASLPLVYISWPSLKNRRSAGMFRFFGYETAVLLTVHNIGYWAQDTHPVVKIAGLVLVFLGAGLLAQGIFLLHKFGEGEFGIDDTTKLVISGVYRFIRHPVYAGVLYFGWGMFLQDVSLLSVTLVAAMSVFLYAAARFEEQAVLAQFGNDYAAYMKRSRMFIPFVL